MGKTAVVTIPRADSALQGLYGAQAKGLVQSILQVVSTEDAIEAIQEAVEKAPQGRSALSLARLRGTVAQPEIEAASGPAISTTTASERMQRSSESVRNLIEKGALIGYRPAADKTKFLLPRWQFANERDVFPWVPDLIKAYGSNGIALLNFVVVPRSDLNGDHYLHLLLSGRSEVVINAAKRSNPD